MSHGTHAYRPQVGGGGGVGSSRGHLGFDGWGVERNAGLDPFAIAHNRGVDGA